MTARARGVSQIKTLAAIRGSGVHANERHVHQFQIASMELEKSRRLRERQAAMNRVSNIDARLIEIEALIQKHQAALGVAGVTNGPHDPPMPETKAGANEKRRTLRY